MLETARRGVLAVCLLLGLWLYFLPDPSPLWVVGPDNGPADRDIETLTVSGPLWEAYFRQAGQALTGGTAEKAFARRLGRVIRTDGASEPALFYKYYDTPLADLGRPRRARLRLDTAGTSLSLGVFVPDGGLAAVQGDPPAALTHPWRKTGWKAWPAGLLTALFLPWPTRDARTLRWPRRKILLFDVCWLGLTGLGFGLPLVLSGGRPFSTATGAALTAGLWAVSCLGLVLGRRTARLAASGVRLLDDGLILLGTGDEVRIPYARVARVLTPPRKTPAATGWAIPWTVRLVVDDGREMRISLGDPEQARRLALACAETPRRR